MLQVSNLQCAYADIVAVNGVSFSVGQGEILGLIGANGAGKTTIISALAGLVSPKDGTIMLDGQNITNVAAHDRVDHGIALVPEGRRVFADLTVNENLTVGGTRLNKHNLARHRAQVFEIFPRLAQRHRQQAGSLSGGEQQMLAIGRAMMAAPRLLLVDELSLGLMPIAIDECYQVVQRLKDEGLTIILVEQNTERVLTASHRIVVMESGQVAWTGSGEQARHNTTLFETYIGLSNP